jgi:hypothetical protein
MKLFVTRPTQEQLYQAGEVYEDVLHQASMNGLYDDQDLFNLLLDTGLWTDDDASLLKRLPKDIEDAKVALLQAKFNSGQREVIRKALVIAKDKLTDLGVRRNAFNYLSITGTASIAKSRFILGCALRRLSGDPVFRPQTFWRRSSRLLDRVMTEFVSSRLEDTHFRELARTDPWRSMWATRKGASSIFGMAVSDLTDEQRQLLQWSILYDNVVQHPEAPADEVLEDNDMFDGWLIVQKRKREAAADQSSAEGLITNEKIRNSEEVYLMAGSQDDARRVMNLNDEHGKAVQRQRFAYLAKQGTVSEVDMPNTRRRLQMEITQAQAGKR